MINFLSKTRSPLRSLIGEDILFAFDFDGTLSPIVKNPINAILPLQTRGLLQKLQSMAPVAVISGRSLKDLKNRLGFKPDYIIGNHGIEGLNLSTPVLRKYKNTVKIWSVFLGNMSLVKGVLVENKIYSLSIHFRGQRAKNQIENSVSQLKPRPLIMRGKHVFNLLPFNPPLKGEALLFLLKKSKCKKALYLGDDLTDEEVFKISNLSGPIFGVRVGRKKKSEAPFFINQQSDLNSVLANLIKIQCRRF